MPKSCKTMSQAEMIDEQLNKLCKETGLIKKHLLWSVGIYPELWAKRLKLKKGLTDTEKNQLQSNLKKTSDSLRRFQIGNNVAESIEELHVEFGIFKGRLLEACEISYALLERKQTLPAEKIETLKKQLNKISSDLKQFSLLS